MAIYEIKCDECKVSLGRTDQLAVSAAGGKCDRCNLLTVAKGCLGYFEYMKAQGSKFTPDDNWLLPLRSAIKRADLVLSR